MKIQHIAYLSLGSNQGNRLENLQKAVDLIANKIGTIQNIASVYKTPALGFNGSEFLNTVIKISTYLSSEKLIKCVLLIEKEIGRIRSTDNNYIDRIIDIDILLFNNETIFSENITVPHPRMLSRKFVLVPLAEIAPKIIHPITKKSILTCLQACTDASKISVIKEQLKKPTSILEKYNYIAIEGNIGAGKTSLAKKISNQFNAKLILEQFAENPFLPKFYTDNKRYAFPLEMSFLADRHQQLSADLTQLNLFKKLIVSDYYILKSLIFAQITLHNDEYKVYRKMFDLLYKDIHKPDLYIYLHQNTNRLLQNIKNRGRDYEQHIKPSYLEKIQEGYANFLKTEQNLTILVIDISNLDFVNNFEDYQIIIDKIKNY
ncbi:2-amino-4-hydroxy-6-hydroxymethyldihydropteridine diphosphokinase [Tenacibaculum sp. UWU-22]|uniref:2-amino-4-hydroxy-6- hydroxymethyldihydropteridine diphosphokinase n=1 Tax=Tenacibaculum sp. UWU-22 TaxID=3234187 RepID=UPI0034DB55DF